VVATEAVVEHRGSETGRCQRQSVPAVDCFPTGFRAGLQGLVAPSAPGRQQERRVGERCRPHGRADGSRLVDEDRGTGELAEVQLRESAVGEGGRQDGHGLRVPGVVRVA
jgi:hypothetical protein